MDVWFMTYFLKSQKRQSSFQLGTNGSEKAPVDMWEALNSWFLEEKSSFIINVSYRSPFHE